MTPIDEAALKAGISDEEIGTHGESMKRHAAALAEALAAPGAGPVGTARKPVYGELMRGIWAGEKNPHRDGMYVKTVRSTGRMNRGTFYELTDGKGRFWQYPAESTVFLALTEPVAVVPAEQAEDSAMLDWLEREHFSLSAIKEPCGDDQFALWWQVTQGRKSISGHPLASPREAIRAAIGRNREAGGS